MSKRSLLLFLCHQATDIWVYVTSEDAEAAFQSFINNSNYKFILDHPHFRNELFTNILTSTKKKNSLLPRNVKHRKLRSSR